MTLLKFVGILLGILALPTAAQQDYTAADRNYSLTVPKGWSLEAREPFLHVSKAAVRISLLTLPAESADASITAAFERLEISQMALLSETDAPLPNGLWQQQIYADGAKLVVALAQLHAGEALVMLIVGEQSAVQAVNPEILQLLTSIRFADEPPSPAYVVASAFAERDVRFGADPFVLSGTLSSPIGAEQTPAVVIVHGSGPHNRDGLIGPLTPYRDLAQGLASRGIAVLRYDKRTLTYGAEITIDETFTIDSESTDDALYAAEFLRQQAHIDSARVYVLGHSQGALVTPRILARDDKIAGGILLAAPARPFSVLLSEQLDYLAEVNPEALESPTVAFLQGLTDRYSQVAAGASYAEAFGESANYNRSLETLNAIAEARDLHAPLLVMQGERDYQVTMLDFARWQEAFATNARVTLRSYAELNHMFMATGDLSRRSVPQDYAIPAFVDARVINTIAEWIMQDRSG